MSLDNNHQLARKVSSAVEEWIPSKAHGHESKFQNELQDYLDKRLNAEDSMTLGPSEDIVVEREHGSVNGDVVVNGSIGIEMKRNLDNGQTNTLRGQIENYQEEYTHVIVVACGIDDTDGWRKLKNKYEKQTGIDMGHDTAPVKFIHKRESNYGRGESADKYVGENGSGQAGDEIEQLASVLEDGVRGYQSLTGDGSMESTQAVAAVTKALVVVGIILVVAIYIFITFI
jgi:hypothetical protein